MPGQLVVLSGEHYMADICMCTNTLCPKAGICYRVQATPSHWQSMGSFKYTIGDNGVECVNYIKCDPITATVSNHTKSK